MWTTHRYRLKNVPCTNPYRVHTTTHILYNILQLCQKNEATDLEVSQLLGSTIAIISAHHDVPSPHTWASAGQGPSSRSLKPCKSDGRVKIYNSVSATSPLTKSKKKKYREHSNIKCASVSALTCSMPSKMAKVLQIFTAHIRN